MITRNKVLEKASIDCLKELYSKAQPTIDWDDFMEENRLYSKAYKQWESLYKESPEKAGSALDFCGPRPYEFYYLPREVMKDICDDYIRAYKLDSQEDLLDTIEILKHYCKEPIVDKWIEDKNGDGHRGYDHPDNLVKEVTKILTKYDDSMDSEQGEEIVNKFFEFLDMAGNFYNWNYDLNYFNMNVYLGASPNSNKEKVIENWKLYRDKDISIDESIYYDEED